MHAKRLQWLALSLALRLGPIALLTSACAPLQQAPLVYTSGQTIGVRVGSSPTQAEAFEVMIGVKLLDAAYAPVAVARSPSADLNERNVDWGIKEIYGVFGEELTPDAHKRLRPEELQSVQTYLQAASELKGAESKLQTENAAFASQRSRIVNELALVEGQRGELSKLRATCDATAGSCTEDKNKELSTQLDSLDKRKAALELERTQLSDAELLKAKAELKQKQAALDVSQNQAVEALQKLSNVRKRDALSVYGSFNSDVRGDGAKAGPGAALKLGKVFSTGVAAQNLSEAEKSYGMGQAITACMNGLAEIAVKLDFSATARESFLNRGMDKCVSIGKADPAKPPG